MKVVRTIYYGVKIDFWQRNISMFGKIICYNKCQYENTFVQHKFYKHLFPNYHTVRNSKSNRFFLNQV